jgi:hypothetical protein
MIDSGDYIEMVKILKTLSSELLKLSSHESHKIVSS